MREISAEVLAELIADTNRPVSFFEWVLGSSTLRLYSGRSDKTWNSQTWYGNGWFRGISSIREVGEVEAVGLQIDLVGVPQSLISTILSEARQGARVAVHFGFLDSNDQVIDDPLDSYIGRFDTVELSDDPVSPSITVFVESALIDLDKRKELLFTNEAQKALFAGDRGFEYVGTLQDAKFYWGNKKNEKKKKKRRVNR